MALAYHQFMKHSHITSIITVVFGSIIKPLIRVLLPQSLKPGHDNILDLLNPKDLHIPFLGNVKTRISKGKLLVF